MVYNLRKRKLVQNEPAPTPPPKKSAPAKKTKLKTQNKEEAPQESSASASPTPPPVLKKAKLSKAKKEAPVEELKPEPIAKQESRSKKSKQEKLPPAAPVEAEPEPEPAPKAVKAKAKAEPKAPASLEQQPTIKKAKLTRSQFVFGEDTCGEFGLGKIGIAKKLPTNVPIEDSIQQVACGPMHTLSLTTDGKVYSYGCNDEGALGRETDGNEKLEATPTLVELDGKVIKISAGDSHSAALTDQQEVYIWGNFRDEHGPVGLTPDCDGQSTLKPIRISLNKTKFKDIASGSNHMLLLDVDGNVYSFGVGAQGQLGRLKVDDVGDTGNSVPITADNRDLFLIPQKVNLKNVDPQRPFVCDAIYAGNFSSFATNTDKKKNRLAGWGLNNYFQLGYKGLKGQLVQHVPKRSTFTCSTSMIDVACGQHHTLFLTKTGRVYAAGRDEYGMLGLGKVGKEVCPAKCIDSLGNTIKKICAGINTSFAVDEDGKLYAWGMSGINLGTQDEDKDLIKPTEIKSLDGKRVVFVSAGGTFTSVIVE